MNLVVGQGGDLESPAGAGLVGDGYHHVRAIAPLAEARGDARSQLQVVVADGAVDQHQRTLVIGGAEMGELTPIAAQEIIFTLFAADDELEMRARAQVPSDLKAL